MKVKEFATVVSGATPSSKCPEYYDGDIAWFTPKDLSDQGTKHVSQCERYITKAGYDSCSTTMLPAGSVLMSSRAPIGLLAIADVPCCTNQGFKSFDIDRSKCDPEYLYYYLKLHIKEVESLGSGTTFKEVSKESVENYDVALPDLDVQKHIISVLRDIDSKTANNNAICSNLEAIAKLLYDYWFVQFDFPDENGKPYKSSGGKMVWNEELKREIPEGWEVTTIGDITLCHDSKRVPVSNKDREKMQGNIPYYGATGIMGYVNKAIFSGDYVLLAEDGSVMDDKGYPIIQRVSGEVWINNHAHVLQPIKGYSCRLLMMVLKYIPVVQIKTGSIQMKINQENLNKYKVVSIPNKLIQDMNKILNPIEEKILRKH